MLWGEIRRFIQTSRYPLDAKDGGPLVVNHLHLRKQLNGVMCPLSYMIGRQAAKGEGMLGHHIADVGDGIPRTLWLGDEGSGLTNLIYERAATWAKRILVIGNPYPSVNGGDFFEKGCMAGDLLMER